MATKKKLKTKKSKKKSKTETISVLPEVGLISCRKLRKYLRIRSVESFIMGIPDGVRLIKVGEIDTSLINLKELNKGVNQTTFKVMKDELAKKELERLKALKIENEVQPEEIKEVEEAKTVEIVDETESTKATETTENAEETAEIPEDTSEETEKETEEEKPEIAEKTA